MSAAATMQRWGGLSGRRLGWTEEERRTLPYAHHWRPEVAPLCPRVLAALAMPVAEELLPPGPGAPPAPIPGAGSGADLEAAAVPDGWTTRADGSVVVHLRTPMPGVRPPMIDWWFGWHSDSPERYQLWHPQAHVHACWEAPPPAEARGRARYVGRVSLVEEYLGAHVGRYRIAFRPPGELGFTDPRLADPERATAVCARVGLAGLPVDLGWLAHLVVAGPEGSVMYSRFWLGGPNLGARAGALAPVTALLGRLAGPGADEARALLAHCAQEMGHLAALLPALYAEQGGG